MGRVFISGGKGGLARAVAARFSAAGWAVDAPSRAEQDVGDSTAGEERYAGRPAYDLAVCAAGVTKDRPFLKQTEDEWDAVMGVDARGAAWCARCAAAGMLRWGREGQVEMLGS